MASKMPILSNSGDDDVESGSEERSGCSNDTISAESVEGLYFISARAWIVDGEAEMGCSEIMALSINSEVEAAREWEAQSA